MLGVVEPDWVKWVSVCCNQNFASKLTIINIFQRSSQMTGIVLFWLADWFPIEDGSPTYTYILINKDCFMVLSILQFKPLHIYHS